MARRKPRGLHNLYLRNGTTWWTRINEERLSTGCPKAEVIAAKEVRDKRLAEAALRREGIEVAAPLPRPSLAKLIDSYLEAESQPYDRQRGGEQAGTKRSSRTDRFSRDRVLRHLDGKMLASEVRPETVIRLAEAIAREKDAPLKVTRKKSLAFLRRVYSWAAERESQTGVQSSPFGKLTRQQRKELFPKGEKRGYVFSSEQLREIYARAGWRRPLVRFAAHTAMRFGELVTLTWGCVNLPQRFVVVEARYAKNGREREVPLGDVSFSILEGLKPETIEPSALVFTKPNGSSVESIRTWWDSAVSEVWKPSKPSERRPRIHDLRKTAGTRVESVSSHAVAKLLLGHADGDVTDTYLMPTAEDVRAALNRAARLIDGEQVGNVIPFAANGTPDGTANSHAR